MIRHIKITPEVLSSTVLDVSFSGGTSTFRVPLKEMLSGGTNGNSLYTGMTVPILLTESCHDLGHYDTWDGNILQNEVMNNFIYSADTTDASNKTICMMITSDVENIIALQSQNTVFEVTWGDGTTPQIIGHSTSYCHSYQFNGEYSMSVKATSVFGTLVTNKTIKIPLQSNLIPSNAHGTAFFQLNEGSWSGTPADQEYIHFLDSDNSISGQVTIPNFMAVPYPITGETYSRLTDLAQYGVNPYAVGPVHLGGEEIGGIICNPCADGSSRYYLGNPQDGMMILTDKPDGSTTYSVSSDGLRSDWLLEEPIVKNEELMKVSMRPEVQSNVFIERGKLSIIERIQRMGEVDNVGDMERYGYKFFNMVN